MTRAVLIVEDEIPTRRSYKHALEQADWNVYEAKNSGEAIKKLQSDLEIDIMLLDLRLPNKDDGFQLLEYAKEKDIPIPSTCVISAYLDGNACEKLFHLGVKVSIPKPIDPKILPRLLDFFQKGKIKEMFDSKNKQEIGELGLRLIEHEDTKRNIYYFFRPGTSEIDSLSGIRDVPLCEAILDEKVKRREKALKEYFLSRVKQPINYPTKEPLLIVARRWNSWYPSFFNANGGAYVILAGDSSKPPTKGCLIDPGFRALSVLNKLKIPVSCLSSCIATHNHPDHIGGIFEYLAARHVFGEETHIFCSDSVCTVLDSMAGSKLNINKFSDSTVDIIPPYTFNDQIERRIRATSFKTAHFDISHRGTSLGIIISSDQKEQNGEFHQVSSTVILGDTEYSHKLNDSARKRFDDIREALMREDMQLVILHIGSLQLKTGTGKHLYVKGLVNILRDIDHYRSRNLKSGPNQKKLLIAISEWGLEHASVEQLRQVMPDGQVEELEYFFRDGNLLRDTVELIQDQVRPETLTLIPADVGLTLGIESGSIYVKENDTYTPYKPEEITVTCDHEGLHYEPESQ